MPHHHHGNAAQEKIRDFDGSTPELGQGHAVHQSESNQEQ
jgi:hypothetical protein